jgi:hypothetical protein
MLRNCQNDMDRKMLMNDPIMKSTCTEQCNLLEKSAFKPKWTGFCNQLTGNGPVDTRMVAEELEAQTKDSHDK